MSSGDSTGTPHSHYCQPTRRLSRIVRLLSHQRHQLVAQRSVMTPMGFAAADKELLMSDSLLLASTFWVVEHGVVDRYGMRLPEENNNRCFSLLFLFLTRKLSELNDQRGILLYCKCFPHHFRCCTISVSVVIHQGKR